MELQFVQASYLKEERVHALLSWLEEKFTKKFAYYQILGDEIYFTTLEKKLKYKVDRKQPQETSIKNLNLFIEKHLC